MLLWIEGALKFGEDSDGKVCSFIDKIICCSKPASSCELDELVSRQEHKHSFTCKKKFQKQCRFHFPQLRNQCLESAQSYLETSQ
jgi:hypothetical protein